MQPCPHPETPRLHPRQADRAAAFTLVELAIVLVIVGLVVGAILIGQDLIKTSEVSSTLATVESYNAAAMAFRTKYNGIPGDVLHSRASQFDLAARSGAMGHGDSNGAIEGCARNESALGCETALFWIDLSTASLIDQSFAIGTSIANGDALATNVASAAALSTYVPTLALRDTAQVHVFNEGGRNFFLLAHFTTDASGDIQLASPSAISVGEASQIDLKIDDGLPHSGIVRAVSALSATGGGVSLDAGATPAASGECVDTSLSLPSYNTTSPDYYNEFNCSLRLKTQF